MRREAASARATEYGVVGFMRVEQNRGPVASGENVHFMDGREVHRGGFEAM